MIARLIQACIQNRTMVMLLTAFVVLAGVWSIFNINIDAIPDLSDVQVVIRTEYPGQAPQIVQDQVTYPLTTAMLAVPYAKVVRGYSMFGSSFVYIIFEDGTDLYWARSRVLEQLNFVAASLPRNVSPQLGPDATGVGWVYEYVLVTGKYCPEHPQGLWQDPDTQEWYEQESADARGGARPGALIHQRVFIDEDRCPLDGITLLLCEQDLSDLRSLQDWYLRYELTAVNGVSEVASVGGFVKQYQVVVDPVKLLAFKVPLQKIKMAIKRSNADVGGRLIEMSETEYMLRGVGYLGSMTEVEIDASRAVGQSVAKVRTQRIVSELGKIALGATDEGTPIYLADLAQVRVGPDIRRGVAEWNGEGEVAAGIIVMRFGENARSTIQRVKAKLTELEKGLPPGVAIKVGYDRSDLINRAVATLSYTLAEEIIVVTFVCIIFLLHARSALVAVFVLPTGVLASLSLMHFLGINANIMSLGGIAIAIGVMVDSSIVMVENAHKHLELEKTLIAGGAAPRPRSDVIAAAAMEVGPRLFFSLLIITASFLPVFALGDQSGRLFKPLAFTKTFAMGTAAILAVTIIPVLMVYFISERMVRRTLALPWRMAIYLAVIAGPAVLLALLPFSILDPYRPWLVAGWVILSALIIVPQTIPHEDRMPISRILQWLYKPIFTLVMRFWWLSLALVLVMVVGVAWPYSRLGNEFMPPLEEGDLLYMPTTDPGISMTKARELLQQTDKLIMQFPEVETVMGKIGRADTATDIAPPSMLETTITLRRDRSQWRTVPVRRFYRNWPGWLAWLPDQFLDDTRPISIDELINGYTWPGGVRVPGLNEIVQVPGLTNAWTMPIKTRIDMLSTGIKTPVGIKVMGSDLKVLARISSQIAQVVKTSEGTGEFTTSAFPEKSVGGNYLDVDINRDEIARYALTIGDVQDVIMSAMGGMNVSSTVEGLERYPINVRYPHELRDNLPALKQTLVATPSGAQVPLGQLATFRTHKGAPMVKSENARLTSWVYVDIAGIDVGTFVNSAQRAVAEQVTLPAGYSIVWSGQFEYMEAARKRMIVVAPVAIVLIVMLLYVATRSWLRVAIVLTAVPMSMIGAFWFLYALDYNLSVAVWVGIIALAGLDAEMGLVLLLYLDLSFNRFAAEGRMRDPNDLWWAVYQGAVERVRPITMTTLTTFIGLFPLLWASGAGADTMRRLAAPMIGGLATGYIGVLLIFPVIFYLAKRITLHRQFHRIAERTTLMS
jgi:Cu(I)/Ag(I) efflux system membrane protein CusA/SilA